MSAAAISVDVEIHRRQVSCRQGRFTIDTGFTRGNVQGGNAPRGERGSQGPIPDIAQTASMPREK
jgi:hypothetical protein